MSNTSPPKICILLVGPESSGTRWLSGLLTQHSCIYGPDGGHSDPLDSFWRGDDFPSLDQLGVEEPIILTRRSMPSSMEPTTSASYMQFDDFDKLEALCSKSGFMLKVLITTRSPEANISSWYRSRSSTLGSREKACQQYREVYRRLLRWLDRDDGPEFWFLSLEAAILEGKTFINSVCRLLGLQPEGINVSSDYTVNFQRYQVEEQRRRASFELGEEIELVSGAKGLMTTAGGWAKSEVRHSWTVGTQSRLVIPLRIDERVLKDLRELQLTIVLKPFVFDHIVKSQHLKIAVNNRIEYVGDIMRPAKIVFCFGSEALHGDGVLAIDFFNPNAVIPSSINPSSSEGKEIAFAVSSLTLALVERSTDTV